MTQDPESGGASLLPATKSVYFSIFIFGGVTGTPFGWGEFKKIMTSQQLFIRLTWSGVNGGNGRSV